MTTNITDKLPSLSTVAIAVVKAPFQATAYLIKEGFGLGKAIGSFFGVAAADAIGEEKFGKSNYQWIVRPGVVGPYNYLWKRNSLFSSTLYAYGLSASGLFNKVVGKIVDITPPLRKLDEVLNRGLDQVIRFTWNNLWSDEPISKIRLRVTRTGIKSFASARAQVFLINQIATRFFKMKAVPPELLSHLHDAVYQAVFTQCIASVMEYIARKQIPKPKRIVARLQPVKPQVIATAKKTTPVSTCSKLSKSPARA